MLVWKRVKHWRFVTLRTFFDFSFFGVGLGTATIWRRGFFSLKSSLESLVGGSCRGFIASQSVMFCNSPHARVSPTSDGRTRTQKRKTHLSLSEWVAIDKWRSSIQIHTSYLCNVYTYIYIYKHPFRRSNPFRSIPLNSSPFMHPVYINIFLGTRVITQYYTYTYICIYICIYIYMYTYTYTYIYIYLNIFIFIYSYNFIHINAHHINRLGEGSTIE
jgi:hypothetical protein